MAKPKITWDKSIVNDIRYYKGKSILMRLAMTDQDGELSECEIAMGSAWTTEGFGLIIAEAMLNLKTPPEYIHILEIQILK